MRMKKRADHYECVGRFFNLRPNSGAIHFAEIIPAKQHSTHPVVRQGQATVAIIL
jgi:hypothetical protein